MKTKFTAFLREKQSLRELVVTDAGKPSVDAAFALPWQSKLNLLAMESDKSTAVFLRVQQTAVNVWLQSNQAVQTSVQQLFQSGLYLRTGYGSEGMLIANRSTNDTSGSPAAIPTCFGLPVQWPDGVLFGVLAIVNYPGKKLKPVYENLLSDLQDTIELALDTLQAPPVTDEAEPAEAPATVSAPKAPAAVQPEAETPEEPAAEAPVIAETQPAPEAPATQPAPVPVQNTETDTLTGIYSRKKIEEILKHEFERARRYFKTFSVSMIDLNGFQALNANFGQDAGDAALKAFAKSVGSKIRETDSWGRWNGDAFILVCPYADTVETQQMFARIKPLVSSDMKDIEGFSDYSLGVSQYEPEDLSYMAIIGRAEDNMHHYQEVIKRKPFLAADDRNAGTR